MGRTKASYLVSHLLLCVFFVYISVAILFQSVHDLFLIYLHAVLNHVFEKFFEKEDLFPLKYSGFTLICRCNYKWVGIAILDGVNTFLGVFQTFTISSFLKSIWLSHFIKQSFVFTIFEQWMGMRRICSAKMSWTAFCSSSDQLCRASGEGIGSCSTIDSELFSLSCDDTTGDELLRIMVANCLTANADFVRFSTISRWALHFRLFLLKCVYFTFIALTVGQMLIVCFWIFEKEACVLRAHWNLTV